MVLLSKGSRVVARLRASERGTFRLSAAPGVYEIAGGVGFCPRKSVLVRPGQRVNVLLSCSIL
jgi:hypothetical protein